MRDIIRIPEYPDLDTLTKEDLDRWGDQIEKSGLVEQIDTHIDPDGYHVEITRTLWTRNKRRNVTDQREHPIRTDTVLRLTGHQVTYLVEDLVNTLLHVDGRGPKKEE